jgi:hypothetical protein
MTAMAKPQAAAALESAHSVGKLYLETLNLVERLHRQLLDVIKDELDRRDEREINSVQALLLFNVGDQELTAGELRTRAGFAGRGRCAMHGASSPPFKKWGLVWLQL